MTDRIRPEQVQQIILELVIGSGSDFTDEKIRNKILPLYLKKLNCFAALVYQTDQTETRRLYSVPVSFQRSPDSQLIDEHLSRQPFQDSGSGFFLKTTQGVYHLFGLPGFGFLVLGRVKPLDEWIQAEMQPLIGHLARSFIFGKEVERRRMAEQQVTDQHRQVVALLDQATALNTHLSFAEERHRSVMTSALDCIVIADHEGKIMEWNPAAEQTFGWSRSEIIGQKMSATMIPHVHREAHQKGMREFLATGHGPVLGKRIEITALRKSGEEFPVELAITPVQSLGFPIFIAYLRDISDRKAAEAEIKNQSTRLTSILKNIGDGVMVLNHKNQVLLINPIARHLLGVGDRDVKSAAPSEWFPGDFDSLSVLLNSVQPGSTEYLDLDLLHPETRILSFVMTAFLLDSSEETGKILVLRDVTREREVDRMKTEFVSQVSHELRTPLTSIIGFTQTIRDDHGMPPDIRNEFLRIIHDESRRLSNLIDNILSLSKIESGTLQLDRKSHDACILIREIVQTYSILIDEKKLSIDLLLPDQPAMMWADRDSVTVILVNLLSNAIKFTEPGGKLSLKVSMTSGSVRIWISDSGIGIPKKDLHRIFDKFYRSAKVKNVIKGSGLGLSIVKKLVDEHQGSIEVTSEEGKGTTFMIQLPSDPN